MLLKDEGWLARVGRVVCSKVVIAWFAVWSLDCSAATILSWMGTATDIESGADLYHEYYRVTLNPENEYATAKVVYVSPAGEVFAFKTLNYEPRMLAPQLVFTDFRRNRTTSVDRAERGDGIVIQNSESGHEERVSAAALPMVIDAGFDRLVQTHWSDLIAGQTIKFSFLALNRAEWIRFRMKSSGIDKASGMSEVLRLSIQPENTFIRWLVDPISLEYDLNTRRLLRFSGLTNIEKFGSGNGDNISANIHYRFGVELRRYLSEKRWHPGVVRNWFEAGEARVNGMSEAVTNE
ncbi:MAG: hypothetical protein MI864_25330 [Pseudomonadales bacterium]|nr:hypothetical protein [Pseudomonadales bacterium]